MGKFKTKTRFFLRGGNGQGFFNLGHNVSENGLFLSFPYVCPEPVYIILISLSAVGLAGWLNDWLAARGGGGGGAQVASWGQTWGTCSVQYW
jgi:hypothetical protein